MIEQLEETINEKFAEYNMYSDQVDTLSTTIKQLKTKQKNVVEPSIEVLKTAVDVATNEGETFLTNLLTEGVCDVFGKDHKISIEWYGQENNKSAKIVERRPDGSEEDITLTSGDSHIELVALLARMIAVNRWNGKLSQIIIDNEALSNFNSNESMQQVLYVIKEVCAAIDQQVILVVHASDIEDYADNVILVDRQGDESKVISI